MPRRCSAVLIQQKLWRISKQQGHHRRTHCISARQCFFSGLDHRLCSCPRPWYSQARLHGLDRGWDAFLDEAVDGVIDGRAFSPTNIQLDIDYETSERLITLYDVDGAFIASVGDTIEAADQTFIDGTAGADTIDLRGGSVDLANGLTSRDQDTVAIAGADFTALSDFGSSFVSTSRRATVSVLVAADDAAEGNERFALDIATASGYQIIGPQDGGSATVTIVDGASALPTLLVGRAFVAESTTVDNTAIVRLSLSKASSEAVTVALALQNGTALGGGVDYGATGRQSAGQRQRRLDRRDQRNLRCRPDRNSGAHADQARCSECGGGQGDLLAGRHS
ncbi:Calx-beta domain-containing protein [Hankyongella ginsenosidimutans]|uniref:Calx-beta domain-containing protein n=1 Tax=Hankyongella ginsenosidimutans TaxID=1763828 RepID=UPI001CA31317|nr:hypothetical protein [Hankyongella ginsenosidimutans]